MPGIVAIIDPKGTESLLKSMASSITHEEWQKSDIYMRPPVGLARVHLGITNPEKQPIFNEDESAFIFMDGEIYNYELEKTKLKSQGHLFRVDNDAEFCLHLYEDYGERFIDKLEGSFVIVICNLKNKHIILANDRHGSRNLYLTNNGDRYIFSSEVKAILKDKTFKKEIDDEAVADFFAFGKMLNYRTFFTGVRTVPPGSMFVWSNGKMSEKRYWTFKVEDSLSSKVDFTGHTEKLVGLLIKAAKKRTKGNQRLGVFLSGGLDSRTVAGAVKKEAQGVNTFTYGVKGGDEVSIARRVARSLRTNHHFVEFKKDHLAQYAERAIYLTDGMMPCVHIWWFSSLPTVRENVDVVFPGIGLDILVGTYLSRLGFRHPFERIPRIFFEREMSRTDLGICLSLLFSGQNNIISSKVAPLFYSKSYYEKIKGHPFRAFVKSFEKAGGVSPISAADYLYLESLARVHLSLYLVRNFVEDRLLVFDNDFFDYALKIPTKLRFGYKLYFKFLTLLAPEIARLPYQRTGVPPQWPLIAHRIGFIIKGGYKLLTIKLREITRGKISLPQNMGYPQLDGLIRSDARTREFFERILLDQKTLSRRYFNPDFIVKILNEHMENKRNWGIQLCTLLTFELWNRLFIDSDGIQPNDLE